MEMNSQDAKDLREVDEIIATLEADTNPSPSRLANIRSFQKVRRRILAQYETDPVSASESMSTADYLDAVRGG